MAELYKRSGSPYWYCIIQDPREPEGRLRKSTKCSLKGEARAFADALQASVDQDLKRAPTGLLWSEAAEIYLDHAPVSESTMGSKANRATIIAASVLGDFDMGALDHEDIRNFIADRRAAFVPRTTRRVSDSTIRTYLCDMSTVFRWTIDHPELVEGAPAVNPFDTFNRRHLGNSPELDNHYRPSQFQDILESFKSLEHRRIVVTFCYTGMRAGELKQLSWPEVDFNSKLLEFGNGDPDRTKKKRARRIAMNELIVHTLLAQKVHLEEVGKYDPYGLVFPSTRTGEERYGFAYIIKVVKQRTGDKRYKNHRLRHTFASWCLQGGLDPFTIRDLLGHKTLSTTERYARLIPDIVADRFRSLDLPGLAQNLAQSAALDTKEVRHNDQ